MASSREIDTVIQVLSSPALEGRPTEEVVAAAIEALDDLRARSRRLAVVGQISHRPQDPTHTVVLGPFSARGHLDTEEKFRKVVERGSAARTAGQDLAWDSKTGKGQGRFMLAPAFMRPRDAWDFFRPPKGELAEGPWNLGLAEERLERIRAAVESWVPGLWDAEATDGPVCSCGAKGDPTCRHCGGEVKRHCPRHQAGAELHVCDTAA